MLGGVSLPSVDVQSDRARDSKAWHALTADLVASALGTSIDSGLSSNEAVARLAQYGPNELKREAKPSVWAILLEQIRDPMNIMLIAVTVVSLVITEWSTALVVGLLVALNVVLGTRQELKARASVDALADMQIPQARVVRDGAKRSVPATEVVPGDLVAVEAGDIVVADGRIARSANVEAQEAALTGESAPIAKATVPVPADAALGDRTDMLYQNTSVTRGSGTLIVTATGMDTEVGKIASLLGKVTRSKSPLQRQLDGLTKWLGIVAWGALAVVVIAGLSPEATLRAAPGLLNAGRGSGGAEVVVIPNKGRPRSLVVPAPELVKDLNRGEELTGHKDSRTTGGQ